ncbi:MAG: cysteine-rich CWC family protein [Betaproteobacteria bacterium]|nr:cysteine-rich CWC family protein [Betaproteobacteria bacterium]
MARFGAGVRAKQVNLAAARACGQPNQCAECEPGAEQPCWCVSLTIPASTLDRIPDALRNRACLCPLCARNEPCSDA